MYNINNIACILIPYMECLEEPGRVEALRVCGIFVESPAAELLLHWLHKQEQQATSD